MIFDLDEGGSLDGDMVASEAAATLPEVQPITEISRAPRRRKLFRRSQSDTLGLPQSLSAIRPSSLPAPASLEKLRDGPVFTHTRSASATSSQLVSTPKDKERANATSRSRDDTWDAPLDQREAEIRRLVAADVPSHRSAWKRDGLAWQTFVRRRGGNAKYPDASMIAEVDEEEDTDDSQQDEEETEEDTSLDERGND
jgi:hypothetical protein